MRLKALFYTLIFFFSISAGNAQLFKKKKDKDTDGDFKFSDYKPAKDKKHQREIKKQIKEQQALSYKPKKSKYAKDRVKETKENRNKMMRLKRSQGDKMALANKEAKITKRQSAKYLTKRDKKRYKQIAYNKKNYGTKATRKANETHKSERNILDNDEGKLFKFRKSS